MTDTPKETPKETRFERMADRVSWAVGTPANIAVWIVLVLAWFLLFGLGMVSADATFMPKWFTGQAFNFPLNTVTTLAELYIGFLIAAAANRNERGTRLLNETQMSILRQQSEVLAAQNRMLRAIKVDDDETLEQEQTLTALTRAVHHPTKEIHGEVVPATGPTVRPRPSRSKPKPSEGARNL